MLSGFRLRYLGPVLLIGLCLIGLCLVTAVSLFAQQAAITRTLRENVQSRRAAVELADCLTDLIALEDDRVESVGALHTRARSLVTRLEATVDQPPERHLHDRLVAAFDLYLARWAALPQPGTADHEPARRAATRHLEAEVLRPCQEFEEYNTARIDGSAEAHERVLRRLAWGMAGVGGCSGTGWRGGWPGRSAGSGFSSRPRPASSARTSPRSSSPARATSRPCTPRRTG